MPLFERFPQPEEGNTDPSALARYFLTSDGLIDLAVRKVSEKASADIGNVEAGKSFANIVARQVRDNYEKIFKLAESPIELLLFNSVATYFAKISPLALHVQEPPDGCTEEAIKIQRKHLLAALEWYTGFIKHGAHKGASTFEEFMAMPVSDGYMTEAMADGIKTHVLMHRGLGTFNAIHLVLQPKFPNVKIQDHSVRPDAIAWGIIYMSTVDNGSVLSYN